MKKLFILLLFFITLTVSSQTYYFKSEQQCLTTDQIQDCDFENKFSINLYMTPKTNSGTIFINSKKGVLEILNFKDTPTFLSYEIKEGNEYFLFLFYKEKPIITIVNENNQQMHCYISKSETLN